MKTLSEYAKRNMNDSIVAEYLMQDINGDDYIPKDNIKGTKSKHNYELIASYDENDADTYYILCDTVHLELLRPQFEDKDIADILDRALKEDKDYYAIILELQDNGISQEDILKGLYNPDKHYTISSNDNINRLRPKSSNLDRGFEYFFDAINLEKIEEICVHHTESSLYY